MRISDWSSDVCSSDLVAVRRRARRLFAVSDAVRVELAGDAAACRVDPFLCLRLYDVAEAADAAEYRHRRRGGRLSAVDRLGCGDGHDRPAAGALVPPHLPLDPAAFLGARAGTAFGLCRGGSSAYPGGCGRDIDAASDSCP